MEIRDKKLLPFEEIERGAKTISTKKGRIQVPDPTSTYEKHAL
jgi:hypothetical protein